MNNKLLYVLFTYNRPAILEKMLETLFANSIVRPDEVLIIDDGSAVQMKVPLLSMSLDITRQGIPCHLLSFNTNQGLARQWQLAFDFISSRDFQYVFLLEQDYLFRQGGIDDALALLKSKPLACAVSGYSNPDFYSFEQTQNLYPKYMIEEFGEDLAPRQFLHKPFKVKTDSGEMEIQLTSNSCGTFLMNWGRVNELLKKYPDMLQRCFHRAFKLHTPEDRRVASDKDISCGFTHYFYQDVKERIANGENIDLATEGAWLDICDFSIADHKNGGAGSLHGHIVAEGQSFVSSPKWKDDYLKYNPRNVMHFKQ